MEGTTVSPANYVPLSPISFLERSGIVYRDETSIIYGSLRFTWEETLNRCIRLASALVQRLGVNPGDVVAVLSPNVPAMYELHFGVPMTGGVLCTLNTRHNASMVSTLLKHSEAKVIFVDYQLLEVAHGALKLLSQKNIRLPVLVHINELDANTGSSGTFSSLDILEYEILLRNADARFEIRRPKDELQPITLNYTSGTTSSPKGVVYSHRGTYLNALASALFMEMGSMPIYLWSVPMFHCNGWCFVWAVAALGGANVCIRNVVPGVIFDNIAEHKVTHMGGAPTVMNMIVNSVDSERKALLHKVHITTGGAPPPPHILFKLEELGFHVVHSYGLTETYGPGTVCVWKPKWNSLPPETQAKIKSRQGLHHLALSEVDVKNPESMESVPPDAKSIGEVMFRGNTVMSGYLKDSKATQEALRGGWFRSGDLGVRHPDGYIELKDRAKDIIISGGENISSIEVESVLYSHPDILEAAVVGRPDDYWGETPCAFVKFREGRSIHAKDIIDFCRDKLPHYMAPKTIVFADLPKTSTGKIQKFLLREKAREMGSLFSRTYSKL